LPPFGSLLHFLEHRADLSVSWSFTDGRTPWTCDQLVARPLPKHRTTQTQKNIHTHQTSMPWVGFETTIPAPKRAKTVHASDRLATVTGLDVISVRQMCATRRSRAEGTTTVNIPLFLINLPTTSMSWTLWLGSRCNMSYMS
jgi:hypothetical protein